jgi:hypothetical protein
MTTRYITVLGAVVLAVVAAGCGSSTTPSSSISQVPHVAPATTAQVAQSYLSATGAVDSAYDSWHAAIVAADGKVLNLTSQASSYVAVLTTFDNKIQNIGATGKAATDIATLVSDDNTFIADLNSLSSQSSSTEASWDAKALSDGLAAVAQGDVVRADLGLPPS